MEDDEMMLFQDMKNEFRVIDYSISHGQLLLRSEKCKERKYNIDILFKLVDTMLLQTTFKGLKISICDSEEKKNYLKEEYNFKIDNNYKIFELIDSTNKTFYINAMAMGVYHNQQVTPLETGISRWVEEKPFGENQFWFAG